MIFFKYMLIPALFEQKYSLCCIRHDPHQEWEKKMDKVTEDKKWVGLTPATGQHVFVEMAVMRYLSEKELWAKVDDTWQAQFMPLWGLVRPRDQGFKPAFVVKVYPNAVITWPAREVARRVWAPSLDVQKLNTRVVLDVDQWEAVPTTSASPFRMHVEDAPPT